MIDRIIILYRVLASPQVLNILKHDVSGADKSASIGPRVID